MTDQLAFSQLLSDADERQRAARDALRLDVQRWFDALSPTQKTALGIWFDGPTFDTCAALMAAAADWHASRHEVLP